MGDVIRDLMTTNPITIPANASVAEAAQRMRDADVGPVIVLDGKKVCGIVTDRDITVRTVAEGKNPKDVKVGEICSKDLTTLEPSAKVDEAVRLMREKAVRRLPVVENGRPVGIVSLGDLAVERDRNSALADISSAPPNQ